MPTTKTRTLWMLVLAAGLSTLFAAACSPPPEPPTGYPPAVAGPTVVYVPTPSTSYYALVLEGIDLSPAFGGGIPPNIFASVLVNGQTASSTESVGTYDPIWNSALMVTDPPSFETGIDVQVWADDGSGPALAGELQFAPTPDEFDGQTVDLGAFDYVTDLRLSFQPQ